MDTYCEITFRSLLSIIVRPVLRSVEPTYRRKRSAMQTVTSADGTTIAYNRAGSGPTIVFVPGAFNDSTTCAPRAEQLQDRYTVVCPDRRGRGHSGDAIS